jgi:hypothetical protein
LTQEKDRKQGACGQAKAALFAVFDQAEGQINYERNQGLAIMPIEVAAAV